MKKLLKTIYIIHIDTFDVNFKFDCIKKLSYFTTG